MKTVEQLPRMSFCEETFLQRAISETLEDPVFQRAISETIEVPGHQRRPTQLCNDILNQPLRDGKRESESLFKVLCYDTTAWVAEAFEPALEEFNKKRGIYDHKLHMDFTPDRLSGSTVMKAAGYHAVCLFVNCTADERVLKTLRLMGVEMIALRCAGYDGVDTEAAKALGLTVARVPAYSPYAVAEHAVALLLAINRRIAAASARVSSANFTLEGLLGFDINGKTVGVMGTGKIGQILCNIMLGFGVNLLCYDVYESEEVKKAGGTYVSKEELYRHSDIIFLMMPLLPATYHTINEQALKQMKPGVVLINTSRGGLVDTKAVLKAVQEDKEMRVAMDVYEKEKDYFFQDWSERPIEDPMLKQLLEEENVMLTAHQAFFTEEAVDKIVSTTLENLLAFWDGETLHGHPNSCLPK